jgi:hypothetical protein
MHQVQHKTELTVEKSRLHLSADVSVNGLLARSRSRYTLLPMPGVPRFHTHDYPQGMPVALTLVKVLFIGVFLGCAIHYGLTRWIDALRLIAIVAGFAISRLQGYSVLRANWPRRTD